MLEALETAALAALCREEQRKLKVLDSISLIFSLAIKRVARRALRVSIILCSELQATHCPSAEAIQ